MTTLTRLSILKSELSERDKNLPLFLYRAFQGQPQEGQMEIFINNVNDCPVSFLLENVRSSDGKTLTGYISIDDYNRLIDLKNKKYN